MEEYKKLFEGALTELKSAADEMLAETRPLTPRPRPRFFKIVGDVVFPEKWGTLPDSLSWESFCSEKGSLNFREKSYFPGTIEHIFKQCKYQPRRILRALRRIQAATEWCRRRAEGRRRAAEEIIRQQSKANETLQRLAGLEALKGLGEKI